MRYNDKVKMFWRLGWRLFCGKFLRLMGGPRFCELVTVFSGRVIANIFSK